MTQDTTPAAPAAEEPQKGGSYVRDPDTGALQLQQATQPAGAEALRHHADATDTPAQEP